MQFRLNHVENVSPANKRAKLDQYVAIMIVPARTDTVSRTPQVSEISHLQPLTLLAEVLGTTEIPGSLDLVSNLLETLNRIVRSDVWGPSDTSYVCQMLMAAIEKSASRLTVSIALLWLSSILNGISGAPNNAHSLGCFG